MILTPPCAFNAPAYPVQRLPYPLPPHLHIRHHVSLLKRRLIRMRPLHHHGRLAMQHPMPVRNVSRRPPRKAHRHHRLAQQRQHPSHRPHKPLRLAWSPVHVLRPVDRRQLLWQLRRNHLRRRPPRPHHLRLQILALYRRHGRQRLNRHPGLLRKRHRRRRRRALLVRNLRARPHQLLGRILLPLPHAAHPHRQPSRRRKALRRRLRAQPCLHQPLPLEHRHHPPP